MASGELTLDLVYNYLVENGGKVKNRVAVRHFRSYLMDPVMKDENRQKFKSYINTLARTKIEGDEKILELRPKYLNNDPQGTPPTSLKSASIYSPHTDPRNALGIPLSPSAIFNPLYSTPPRQPPPYRPPPPPVYASSSSLDTMSLGSMSSLNDTPQAPPRRRDSEKSKSSVDEVTPKKIVDIGDEKISVKERTQKFNRLASVEDELSPRQMKSPDKEKKKSNWGADEKDDVTSLVPLEPKKYMEWYVTASKGDYQELMRLANSEPRLVNKKDPFSAYTVLHWGAKYGNANIIKTFAGTYKVDVNGKTNGGYTPLHISAQFGHKDIFRLLIDVYKADVNIRDYSGRTPEYYFAQKEGKQSTGITLRSEYNRDKLRHGKSKSKSFRNKTISRPSSLVTNPQKTM